VVMQQHSRKLLMMDILMSETCWAHKKWNKIASGIKLLLMDILMSETCWAHKKWNEIASDIKSVFHSSIHHMLEMVCLVRDAKLRERLLCQFQRQTTHTQRCQITTPMLSRRSKLMLWNSRVSQLKRSFQPLVKPLGAAKHITLWLTVPG